jgi:ubiquinone/menaquinone biosynthesis C-methylase UbiE
VGDNPFADPAVVEGYEGWYETRGRRADRLEKALLARLLARFPGARTLLEVGCGTGHFARWFDEQGLQVTGLDLSRPMLVEAARLGSPPCVRGDGVALPFLAEGFDLVALITTLEFVAEPAWALEAALRVAGQGVILGVLNRSSRLGRQLQRRRGPVWGAARLYTPTELVRLVYRAAAGRQIALHWRTTLWPLWPGALLLPWGGFVGMAIELE